MAWFKVDDTLHDHRKSPSCVLGGPQLGLLATNQHYLKGA